MNKCDMICLCVLVYLVYLVDVAISWCTSVILCLGQRLTSKRATTETAAVMVITSALQRMDKVLGCANLLVDFKRDNKAKVLKASMCCPFKVKANAHVM